jgi:hypothetical protein
VFIKLRKGRTGDLFGVRGVLGAILYRVWDIGRNFV